MVKNLKKRENKMIDKIKTINNYKLLARLHALNVKKENENNGFNPGDTVQAVIVDDELYIESLGKTSKIKIKKKGENG